MESMTITRALVLKKRIQERLARKWNENCSPSVILIGQKATPSGFSSIEEYRKTVLEQWQSYQDLITRREKIVSAIAKANSEILVTINGEEMTIAQALEKKRFFEQTLKPLLDQLRRHQAGIMMKYEDTLERETEKANREISDFSNKEKNVSESEAKAMQSLIFKRHEVILEDPLDLKKIIEELTNKVENFLNEIDVVLTEANSATMIEI